MTDHPDEGVPRPPDADPGRVVDPGDLPADVSPAGPPIAPPPPSRPGLSTFTIEGRATPALFVISRLATLLGFAIALAGALGGSSLLALLVGPGLLSLGLITWCGNQAFERRAHGALYAGPSPFLVFATVIAVTFFVAFLIGVLILATIGDQADVSSPIGELVSGLLTAAIFVGLVRLTVVGTGALSWAEMQVRRIDRRRLNDLAFGAALAAPVIVVTVLLAAILAVLIPVTPTSPLPPTGTIGGLLLQLLIGAVIAPVAEEIFFRGFSLTAWERSIGSQRAIVRASLLFALAHVINVSGSSLPEVAGLIVVGMATRLPVAFVLGWVFVRRRSIWASIGLHSAFNAILLVLAHLAFTTAGT